MADSAAQARTKKRKHTVKRAARLDHIDGAFSILAMDISMNRPGFAVMKYLPPNTIHVVDMSYVDNKHEIVNGEKLYNIHRKISEYINEYSPTVTVREDSFSRFNAETKILGMANGATELTCWLSLNNETQLISPTTIKKLCTGSGRATKEEVALSIDSYCSHNDFETDDESDAVAVGIAWLIDNGYIQSIPLETYRKDDGQDVCECNQKRRKSL